MIALALALASTPLECRPLPGAAAFARTTKARWLLLGEKAHGTAEKPQAAADMICALLDAKRPVVVAVEYTEEDQARLDGYKRSDGGATARAALFTSWHWDPKSSDGKSSDAMLRFLGWLRVLRTDGRIGGVIAFDSGEDSDSAGRNRRMSELLAAIDPGPRGVVVALTGSYHAQKRPAMENGVVVRSPGNLLPRDRTVTVLLRGNGGTGWRCTDRCGLQPSGPARHAKRGLRMVPTPDGEFDGTLETGLPDTASWPANMPLKDRKP